MTPESRELFESIIMDHNEHPRNFGTLEHPTHQAEGYNPVCGDRYQIYLFIENHQITNVRFQGHGCALSKASASILTVAVKGLRVPDSEALFHRFHHLITKETEEVDLVEWGEMAVLAGVRKYPNRVKCVNLCWHAFHAALQRQNEISTE